MPHGAKYVLFNFMDTEYRLHMVNIDDKWLIDIGYGLSTVGLKVNSVTLTNYNTLASYMFYILIYYLLSLMINQTLETRSMSKSFYSSFENTT